MFYDISFLLQKLFFGKEGWKQQAFLCNAAARQDFYLFRHIIEKLHYSYPACAGILMLDEDRKRLENLFYVLDLQGRTVFMTKPPCLTGAKNCLEGTVNLLPSLEILYFHFRWRGGWTWYYDTRLHLVLCRLHFLFLKRKKDQNEQNSWK